MRSYTALENLQIDSCLCMHLINLNNLIGPSMTGLMSEYVVFFCMIAYFRGFNDKETFHRNILIFLFLKKGWSHLSYQNMMSVTVCLHCEYM